MESVTVSSNYQVVIAQEVRKIIGVKPGHKLWVIACEDQLVMIPLRSITAARGSLKGIDTNIHREDNDRLRK
jgi:AbrB family looped-hinge helix DNA binding protein